MTPQTTTAPCRTTAARTHTEAVFPALLRKDAEEILRTWRLPLLATVALLLAVSGPFIAHYLKEIVQTLGGAELAVIAETLPEPTYSTAHAQWIKDLNQVFLLVVAVVSGSCAASELSDGSYLFTLTRHVPRWKFMVSKALCALLIPVATIAIATILNVAITFAIYGDAQVLQISYALLTWFVVMTLVVSAAFLVGVASFSQVGAAGAAVGTGMLLQVLSTWAPANSWNPAGILKQADAVLAGQGVAPQPVITGLSIAFVLFGIAIAVLQRKEL